MDRKAFIGLVGAGFIGRGWSAAPDLGAAWISASPRARTPLPRLPEVSGADLTLTAAPTTASVRDGTSEVWTYNGDYPSPLIRLSRGERARIRLVNRLDEETIVHWHGLDVPEAADGHPRFAIGPGGEYAYDFTVTDAPGLYWYHPHTHGRTAPQTYMGMAGLLVVEDEAEAELGLPSGEFELDLVLQDKRLGSGTEIRYAPAMGPDRMFGYLGDVAFANGVADASVEVARGVYRLRIVNGSNARIFELALGDDMPFTVLGADGGFLSGPVDLRRLTLATGERADLLVDFRGANPGDSIMLRSAEFEIPGMMMPMSGMQGRMGRGGRGGMGMGGGGVPQGEALDLLEFVVTADEGPEVRLPARLNASLEPVTDLGTVDRTFRFDSRMMQHTINGRSFAMDRIDEQVQAGRTEVWEFANDGAFPHPVHVHGGQHRILSREGGRGGVMPWERGLKDTALLLPGERIRMAVEFTYTGIFLLHCHNLEHEDAGMMSNFEVVD
ncbi:MAG: multicopper oxidase family protein [Gemmatimonadetes bacterium]|nr:multicopper oxidase family protein [Gemmatimonadota bacterium]